MLTSIRAVVDEEGVFDREQDLTLSVTEANVAEIGTVVVKASLFVTVLRRDTVKVTDCCVDSSLVSLTEQIDSETVRPLFDLDNRDLVLEIETRCVFSEEVEVESVALSDDTADDGECVPVRETISVLDTEKLAVSLRMLSEAVGMSKRHAHALTVFSTLDVWSFQNPLGPEP